MSGSIWMWRSVRPKMRPTCAPWCESRLRWTCSSCAGRIFCAEPVSTSAENALAIEKVAKSREYIRRAITPLSPRAHAGPLLKRVGLRLNDDVVLHAAHAFDAPGDLLGLGAVGLARYEAAQLHD